MNPDTKYRHITVKFTHEQYAYLRKCAKATFGRDGMAEVAKLIERSMASFSEIFIAELLEDRAGEEKAA